MLETNYQNAANSANWPYGDFNKIANIAPVKIVQIKAQGQHFMNWRDR